MYDEKVAPIIGQYAQPIVNQYVQQVDAQIDAIRKQYGAEKQAFVKKVDSLKAINAQPQELWNAATKYVNAHKLTNATDFVAGLKTRLGTAYNDKLEPSLTELLSATNTIKKVAQKDIAVVRSAIEQSKQSVEIKYKALLCASQNRFDRLVPVVSTSSAESSVSDSTSSVIDAVPVSLTIATLAQHMHARLRDQALYRAHQMKTHAQVRASELKVQAQNRAEQLRVNSVSSAQASYQLVKHFSAVNICPVVGVDPVVMGEKVVSRQVASFAVAVQQIINTLEQFHVTLYSRFSSAQATVQEKSSPLILQAKSTIAAATKKVNDAKIAIESSASRIQPSLSQIASLQEIQSKLIELQQVLRTVGVTDSIVTPASAVAAY